MTDVPDPAVRKRSFEKVIPDSRTVAGVTAELSAGDYYVKRVVENPPTPDRTAAAINRYWDISGRKYDGLYPIDFHIVLSGQEIHDGGTVVSGHTDVAISVRAPTPPTRPDNGSTRNGRACTTASSRRWTATCLTSVPPGQRPCTR